MGEVSTGNAGSKRAVEQLEKTEQVEKAEAVSP
jgi:hypothetical protein